MKEELRHERLRQYRCKSQNPTDVRITVKDGYRLGSGWNKVNTLPMICDVYENSDSWLLLWRSRTYCPCAVEAGKDWRDVVLYVSEESRQELAGLFPDPAVCLLRTQTLLFQSLMQIFRFVLPFFGGLYLHGVLMEYRGQGLAFSAPSGTGKTTHAALWEESYPVRILNGDNYILRVEEDKVYAYSPPWCGSSGIFENTRIPFHGAVFLEQAAKNRAEVLTAADTYMNYMERSWLPVWDACTMERASEAAAVVAERTVNYKLMCTPDKEAVEALRLCLKI